MIIRIRRFLKNALNFPHGMNIFAYGDVYEGMLKDDKVKVYGKYTSADGRYTKANLKTAYSAGKANSKEILLTRRGKATGFFK